jgi:hypothetical protein
MTDDERRTTNGPSWAVPERAHAAPREQDAWRTGDDGPAAHRGEPGPYGTSPGAPPPSGFGQGAYGQNPYGQNAYGQGPQTQGPYGQNPYGQGPQTQGPYGQNPYGQNPQAPGPYGQGPGWGVPGGGPYGSPYGMPYGYGYQPTETDKGARTSLILSIVSLVICGVILGPAAVVEGVKARRRIRDSNGRLTGDGMALAGIIIGVIATVAAIFFMIKLFSTTPTPKRTTTVTTRLR